MLALMIPEPPCNLIAKGRVDEARSVLCRVLGNIDLRGGELSAVVDTDGLQQVDPGRRWR
jgi:hypothetical protein